MEEEDYFKHFYWTDIYLNHLIDNFIFLYTHTIFIHFQKNIKKVLIKLPFYWNFPSVTKTASNHLFHYCIIIISNNNLFRRHIFKKYIKKMVDVYTTISFCSLGLLIHVVGLTLLHIRDDMNLYGTQISLITALSLTEMSFLLVGAVRDWILYRDDLSRLHCHVYIKLQYNRVKSHALFYDVWDNHLSVANTSKRKMWGILEFEEHKESVTNCFYNTKPVIFYLFIDCYSLPTLWPDLKDTQKLS